jgi:hypothetical protein
MNKDTGKWLTAHAYVHMLLYKFNHWLAKALEATTLKLPILRILRLTNTLPGLEIEHLPRLQQGNEILTGISWHHNQYTTLDKIRSTLQGQLYTKEHDNLVREHCKPTQYSNNLLKHLAPLWDLNTYK